MRKFAPLFIFAVGGLSPAAFAQDEAPAAAAAPGATAPSVSASAVKDHQAQLMRFQERIADLTRRIEQSEARTAALKSSALSGKVVRTHATILHSNDLGGGLALDHITYILDGRTILDRENSDGRLTGTEALQLFNGPIRAGEHEIQVLLSVRGQAYGPFTYLEGYKFKIKSKYMFQVVDGRSNRLSIVPTQKDDITLEPQDRLTVRYDVELLDVPPDAKQP